MTRAANYSLDGLAERAQAALEAHRAYVDALEDAYLDRQRVRRRQKLPALAIVGMGRAGKDTAGAFLASAFGLTPSKSSSLTALPLVAHMIGIGETLAYAERHDHRQFWISACNALRADDLTRLARWCLGACDLAIGLRGKEEFAAVMRHGVCDLAVWVHRDVPDDPTVEFTREDCDVVVDNTTTLSRFQSRLVRLGNVVYWK